MSNSEFEANLDDASARLDRLKARYEQWFQGVERVPPVRFREQLDRILRELRRRPPNNTMLRFKSQTLFQRWTTMCQYWDRVTRQIEEGTYRRDVMKVRRNRERREKMRAQQRAEPEQDSVEAEKAPPGPPVLELDLDAFEMDLEAEVGAAMDAITQRETAAKTGAQAVFGKPKERVRPPRPSKPQTVPRSPGGAPPPPPAVRKRASAEAASRVSPPKMRTPRVAPPKAAPAAVRPPARAAKTDAGLSKTEMRAVYDRYVEARRKNNERVDNVKYEKLAASIEKMVPKLAKKHAGKKIGFEVVVKDGRVGLKPVAKK